MDWMRWLGCGRFFQDRGIDVKVEYSWGATEVGGVGRKHHGVETGRRALFGVLYVLPGCLPCLPCCFACARCIPMCSAASLSNQQVKASLPGVGGIVDITEVCVWVGG